VPGCDFCSNLISLYCTFCWLLVWLLLYPGVGRVWVIFGVTLINAIIGFAGIKSRARSLPSLSPPKQQSSVTVKSEHSSQEMVPGDLVLLASGDKVPADLRLVKVRNLQVGESALTGNPFLRRLPSRSIQKHPWQSEQAWLRRQFGYIWTGRWACRCDCQRNRDGPHLAADGAEHKS